MPIGNVPTCGPLLIFFPRLALGTPKNARVTQHFCPLLAPEKAGLATADFVPLCRAVLKDPDFSLLRLGWGLTIHALLRGPSSWG